MHARAPVHGSWPGMRVDGLPVKSANLVRARVRKSMLAKSKTADTVVLLISNISPAGHACVDDGTRYRVAHRPDVIVRARTI